MKPQAILAAVSAILIAAFAMALGATILIALAIAIPAAVVVAALMGKLSVEVRREP